MIAPEVYGDPVAMRRLANEIIGRANIIAALPAGFAAALGDATFEGPAADALRGRADTAGTRLVDIVAELRDVATALFADATLVEQMNTDARVDAQRREREAADRDLRAASQHGARTP